MRAIVNITKKKTNKPDENRIGKCTPDNDVIFVLDHLDYPILLGLDSSR